MLKKTAIFLLLVFILQVISIPSASASDAFRDFAGRSAILIERDSELVLYDYNRHLRHPADALTKIMTVLLAAYAVEEDDINDHELVTMTETAWFDLNDNSTTQEIFPEERMTFIDLMYSAYVGNANEACNMIALRIAGSVDAFVRMMNDKAAELGAANTRFVNTHGQYHDMQYTTAYDMYLIFNEAIKSSLFLEISGTYRHITESIDDTGSRTLTSSNSMLNQSSRYHSRNLISGRDSATYEGKYSMIAYAEEDGLSLISVVLGADVRILEDESAVLRNFSETIRLLQWGFTQFSWRDVLKTTELLAKVVVLHGSGADFVNARPETALTLLLDNAIPNDAFIKTVIIYSERDNEPLIAPVSAGDILGEVIITRDGTEIARRLLIANTDVNLNGFEYIRRQIVELLSTNTVRYVIFILAALLMLYIALVIRYNILRSIRLRRIKNAKNDLIRDRHQNHRD